MKKNCPIILQTGFRVFFLGAALYAISSVLFWLFFYIFRWNIFVSMPKTIWHGHEMVYGYSMAVVAGFLLTSVTNWTGRKTLNGTPLLILFLFWCAGRLATFIPNEVVGWVGAACDLIFLTFLIIAVTKPVLQVKQWRQSAILSKIIILFITDILFYISFANNDMKGSHRCLLFAIYMLVSLILTIARKVIPFFVAKGVGYPVTLYNSKFLDISSLILLVLFSIIDVFRPDWFIAPVLSLLLAIIHILRLKGWYTHGIWKKPLLWILFAGYSFLIIGFILKVFTYFTHLTSDYALHAFTYGGIGIFSLGMLARVSWGHTGRDIQNPPAVLPIIFMSIILGACIRVFFPILNGALYTLWIGLAGILWMIAFTLFMLTYFSILTSQRIDGKFG